MTVPGSFQSAVSASGRLNCPGIVQDKKVTGGGGGGGVGVDPRKPGKEGWRKWPISTQELRCDDYVGFGVGWWDRIYCILLLAVCILS